MGSDSSDSDTVFYSLDGSDEEGITECVIKENEEEMFPSACSTISSSDNLIDNIELPTDEGQSENETSNKCDTGDSSHQDIKAEIFNVKKWVALEDLSARVNISIEASVENCEPKDMDEVLSCCISNTDILIAVYSDEDELEKVLHHSGGVTGYVRKYWTGFFPLLLVHLNKTPTCDPVNELHSSFLANNYSFSHRVIIQDISSDTTFLLQSIVRYHLHVHLLQCCHLALVKRGSLSKSLSSGDWKCPGLCKLQTANPDRHSDRTKKKKTFFQSVRRNLTVRRATRRIRTKSFHTSASRNNSS